jgi:uncharacterized protein YndB with AHSA1/START domain
VSLEVVVKRRFRAAREAVFRAFVEPAELETWFSPSPEIATEVLEHDLRPGGRYRIGFRFPDGTTHTVLGVFREIAPPARLAFSWTWEPPDVHAGIETHVTVVFEERGGGTEVTVRHERFPDAETRDRHDEGWTGTLARLAATLGES